MIDIRWARAARDDLEGIRLYLRERNPDAARKVVVAIRLQCTRLRTFPRSAPPVGDGSVFKLSIGGLPYVVLYRLVENRIEIVRVHHTSEDWRAP